MKIIYKYELEIKQAQVINIKGYSKILKVAEQNERLFIWVSIDPESELIFTSTILIFGTGIEINETQSERCKYLDTVLMSSGLVWHVFNS